MANGSSVMSRLAPLADPEAVGRDLAHKLKDQGAGDILQEIFEQERGK